MDRINPEYLLPDFETLLEGIGQPKLEGPVPQNQFFKELVLFEKMIEQESFLERWSPSEIFENVFKDKKSPVCSSEERKAKIQRFLEKRKRRKFQKSISYSSRKKLADSRIRVKGRFVSKSQENLLLSNLS